MRTFQKLFERERSVPIRITFLMSFDVIIWEGDSAVAIKTTFLVLLFGGDNSVAFQASLLQGDAADAEVPRETHRINCTARAIAVKVGGPYECKF